MLWALWLKITIVEIVCTVLVKCFLCLARFTRHAFLSLSSPFSFTHISFSISAQDIIWRSILPHLTKGDNSIITIDNNYNLWTTPLPQHTPFNVFLQLLGSSFIQESDWCYSNVSDDMKKNNEIAALCKTKCVQF